MRSSWDMVARKADLSLSARWACSSAWQVTGAFGDRGFQVLIGLEQLDLGLLELDLLLVHRGKGLVDDGGTPQDQCIADQP